MSNVVSYIDFKECNRVKVEEQPEISNDEMMSHATDVMLETADDVFDEAIILGILNNKVQLSSTYEDVMDVVEALEDALQVLYMEMDEEQ